MDVDGEDREKEQLFGASQLGNDGSTLKCTRFGFSLTQFSSRGNCWESFFSFSSRRWSE